MHAVAVVLAAEAVRSEAVQEMLWFGGGLLVLGLAAMILAGRSHRAQKRKPPNDEPGRSPSIRQ